MSKSKKLIALLLAAMMILSLAAACGKNNDTPNNTDDNQVENNGGEENNGGATATEKVYRTYMTSDCSTLNAHNNVDSNVSTPYAYCSAALFRAVADDDGMGYHFIGDIAEDVPTQLDDKTWEIKIRKEAHWYDEAKTPINADTFIYSWQMQLDPNLANRMVDFLADYSITIVNASAYAKGECDWEDVGIKKIDDYTLQITTVENNTLTEFCNHFTDRSVYPVYKDLYEAGMNADRTETTYGSTLDQWMGCGAYIFDDWKYDNIQVYVKNPDYWLADLFNYDRVEVRVVPEMNARVELFEKGELDSLTPDANTIEKYIDDPRMTTYPSLSVYHIDINCKNPNNPISGSINYRKALYFSLDRETIAKNIFGYQEPAGTYINGMAGISSESGIPYRETKQGKSVTDLVASWSAEGHTTGYNPETALEYMKKAFDEVGRSYDQPVTLLFAIDESDSAWKATAEFMQHEYPTIFNNMIDVQIVTYAGMSATDFKAQGDDKWDLSPNDWTRGVSRTYPHTAFYYYLSTYSSHPNNFFDEEFEAQYAVCEELRSGDYEELLDATAKLEEIYLDKVIQIPVVQAINFELFADRLELPVDHYIPGFGWGFIFGDIVE